MDATVSFKRLILLAVLRHVSPMVIRLISVPDHMDLPEFHRTILAILGWSEAKKYFENCKRRLLTALDSADLETVEKIFATPGSPSVTDALFMACNSTKVEVATFEWLLQKGAQVNGRGPVERTPLHELIMRTQSEPNPDLPNPYDKMKLLISGGADMTAKEGNGLTPLGVAQYLGKHQIIALLSGTSSRSAWEQTHPIEASFEKMSESLVRDHGPLVRVEYLSHWPKFEINFYYQDGACVYSGARTGQYDIHFLSLGYVGQGPRYAKHFLNAAGFGLAADEIAGVNPVTASSWSMGARLLSKRLEEPLRTSRAISLRGFSVPKPTVCGTEVISCSVTHVYLSVSPK